MERPSSSFRYKPLYTSPFQFRLVILHPGVFVNEIHCSLIHTSFDSTIEYEALSYVWGDTGVRRTISVEGQSFSIGTNLDNALRYLRNGQNPRLLWIDAICINQEDLDEKTAQVQKMVEIYSSAKAVLCWLGKEVESEEEMSLMQGMSRVSSDKHSGLIGKAFALLQELPRDDPGAKRNQTETTLGEGLYSLAIERDQILTRYGEYPLASCYSIISMLINRPYWKRVWILQEISLPPVAVIVCGSQTIDRDCFCNGLSTLAISQGDRFLNLISFGSICTGFSEALTTWIFAKGVSKTVENLAFCMWSVVSARDVTDIRDRVFGIQGIFQDLKDVFYKYNVQPDYQLSPIEVFTRFATLLLTELGTLDILYNRRSPMTERPSWVPNFDRRPDGSYTADYLGFCMAKDRGEIPRGRFKLLPESGKLVLSGVRLASVHHCIPAFRTRDKESMSNSFRAWISLLWTEPSIQSKTPSLSLLVSAIVELALLIAKGKLEETGTGDDSDKALSSAMSRLEGQNLFLSSGGVIGTMPYHLNMQIGDEICLFEGAHVPFLIRKCPEGYLFIGPCFLPKVMTTDVQKFLFSHLARKEFSLV